MTHSVYREMRIDSRRPDIPSSQADSSRQSADANSQRPLTDSNYVRKNMADRGPAMLLQAFQRDVGASPQVNIGAALQGVRLAHKLGQIDAK